MKSIYKDLSLNIFCFFLIYTNSLFTSVIHAQNVNFNGTIYNLKHNFQCDNDGIGGLIYDNYPHPRWQLRFGYNNYTYSNVTNNADYGSGASSTYGPPARLACNTFTKTITLPSFTNVPADYVRVDMRSWEEDESFTPICAHYQDQGNSGGSLCVNADDNCYGWASIGSINFWDNAPPCATKKYYGAFNSGSFLSTHGRNGGGSCGGLASSYDGANAGDYGIERLDLYWDFASAPTIVTQPDDISYGGSVRDVCSSLPITLSVVSNAFHGWTLGRWVKWQSAPDVAGSPGTWTDIAGTLNVTANTTQNTFTYTYTPGGAGTTHYRAILSSACATGFASLTTTSSVLKVIVHDATSDPFCTAPACDVMYVDPVNGSDVSGNGRPTTPYKTISKAATANPTYIRVAKGAGTDANIVQIPSNCVIEGGYVRSGGVLERWEKSSAAADKTIITFSGSEAIAGVSHVAAFKSDGKTDWTVKDIDVITANTPAGVYDASNRGMSNYGFLIINSSARYTLSRVNISVGDAGKGKDGVTPANDGGGSTGGDGGDGGAGVNGGNGVTTAGAGGNGLNGGGVGSNNSTNGGAGGTRGKASCPSLVCPGSGGNGKTGGNGKAGANGIIPSNYDLTDNYFIPGGQSESGGPGGGGQGGGGGGGSTGSRERVWVVISCTESTSCNAQWGSGGGKGGQGGSGGSGGLGGGAAIGIWEKSSSNSNIIDVIVAVGAAGVGGTGAIGSNGLAGNNGGTQSDVYCVSTLCNYKGGNGGTGGTGGKGGTGRNGVNGITAAKVVNGITTSTLTASIPFLSTITLDNFSQRSNISGKMCNNSEIDIINTTGSALSLPAGLSIVNDLTPLTSSYSTSGTTKVTTDFSNTFYNISNGTVLNKFLYTAVANRSLPAVVVTPASKVICKGSSFDLNKSNSYDAGAIQQYEYIVFADGSTANSPYSSGTYNSSSSNYTTPSFSSTGKYWVRYRERHNCCGWSRPVFESFNVIDAPNSPTAMTITSAQCYNGSPLSFTINVTATKAYPAFDNWDLFDDDPTFGTPTAIQTSTSDNPVFTVTPTQTTTYYVRGRNSCGVSSVFSNTAVIIGDQSSIGAIVSSTEEKECIVNDNLWHYFRNNAGGIIAAINSNGENLGNVKMKVIIETTTHDGGYYSPKHGNGGLGRDGTCFGIPELSMKRWYTITPQFQPTVGHPSDIKLFFTNAEYSNYSSEINSWNAATGGNYFVCYGYTSNAGDLAVSKNELDDVTTITPSVGGGPGGSTEYELTIPSFSTFRFHTKGGIGMPLPVELTTFTGYNDGDKNILNWTTASELNTDRFEIEKSNQPQQWINIGSVQAAGNSNTPRTYTFNDIHPAIGDNYYRLKMMDLDGSFKYSNVINITVNEVPNNGFISVFPNPTSGDVTILIQSTVANKSRLSIVNMLGQEIISKDISLQKGLNNLQLETSYLSSGAYTISFTDETGKRYIHKLIKN